MYLEWMGDYREFVEAMIGVGNVYSQTHNLRVFTGVADLTPVELQVMEYILENEGRNENMSSIARRLSISQSSFSKKVKQLVSRGLLEKYHASNNGKNIIIRVSDLGKAFYAEYSTGEYTAVWRRIFAKLDRLDKETVQIFTDSLNEFRAEMGRSLEKDIPQTEENIKLVKLEQ